MINIKEDKINLDSSKFLDSVRVFAPATVANMICGFDILGFAVDGIGDEVVLKKTSNIGISIKHISGDDGKLPFDPLKNTVSSSVWKLFCDLNLQDKFGLEVELYKKMPIGSGLGSSAASAVAGLFALNTLLGNPLTRDQLLPYCMESERMASEAAHADNVAPALLGGIILISSYNPLVIKKLPTPSKLHVTLTYPKVEVPTKEARKLIKHNISLKKAVNQWGNIAGLISAIYEEDYKEIGRSMQDDLIEPIRSLLIPYFKEMKEIALENGALCFGISGSGPTVMAITDNKEAAELISYKLKEFLDNNDLENFSLVSKINQHGPVIL